MPNSGSSSRPGAAPRGLRARKAVPAAPRCSGPARAINRRKPGKGGLGDLRSWGCALACGALLLSPTACERLMPVYSFAGVPMAHQAVEPPLPR